jgi:hypothetical protein
MVEKKVEEVLRITAEMKEKVVRGPRLCMTTYEYIGS